MSRCGPFLSRRHVLAGGSVAVSGLIHVPGDAFAGQGPAATPSCDDGDEPTLGETEGPYFKPRSPLRADLREKGMPGQAVELSGLVLTRSCKPVAHALVDLWHADSNGIYDNAGFRLRGHVFTDSAGRYAFDTIMPGLYPGRTRHYHVKVKGPGKALLTTQFYFPDERRNASDDLFRSELLMRVSSIGDVLSARFDVVLG
jgi:protocatechuate 3,4-dioxygenase beta subunit